MKLANFRMNIIRKCIKCNKEYQLYLIMVSTDEEWELLGNFCGRCSMKIKAKIHKHKDKL